MRWMSGRMALLAGLALLPAPLLSAPLRAQTALDSVDRFVRAELARQRIPGMSVAVLRGDSILLAKGYGYANLEHRVPRPTARSTSRARSASSSPPPRSSAWRGRASSASTIRSASICPRRPPRWRKVTIRHLLTHTIGIPDYTAP